MKHLTINIEYDKISEVITDKDRNFIVYFKNGDRFFFAKNDCNRIKRHLIKNFNGDHI